MVTIVGLLRTLRVAKKPYACLPYQGVRLLSFNNGWTFNIAFSQFRDIRDNYSALKKCSLTQLDVDLFSLKKDSLEITDTIFNLAIIAVLLDKHNLSILPNGEFHIENERFKLNFTRSTLLIIRENLLIGDYKTDFKNKTVLDIGGLQGESMVYFWVNGAKKIIVYEPTSKFCNLIKQNIGMNKISNCELHQSGIGNIDETVEMTVFNSTDTEQVKLENISEVISKSKADIAKIDCEGGEKCLETVPNEILRKIPFYMIELHGVEIRQLLIRKFKEAGFKIAKQKIFDTEALSVVHFKIKRESPSHN